MFTLRKLTPYCKSNKAFKYFTEVNIYENADLKCSLISKKNIEGFKLKLCITSSEIIDTICGTSIEGQHLTGKKLFIIGKIIIKFIITCPQKRKSCYIIKEIPLSAFIIIPETICKEQIYIDYLVENFTYEIITRGKIFYSITLLLKYDDF